MAEKIVSPGVFQRETDQSFISPAPVEAGAAIIGPTVKGPIEQPTVVTSFGDYKRKFGTTFLSGSDNYEYFTSIAVQKFFANGGNSMLITRVTSGSFESATSSRIYSTSSVNAVGSSFAVADAPLVAAAVDGQEFSITYEGTTYSLIASDDPVPDDVPTGNVFYFSTGSTPTATVTNLAAEINGATKLSAFLSATANGTTLELSGSAAGDEFNGIVFKTGSILGATPDFTLATLAGGAGAASNAAAYNTFTLKTIGKGALYNNTTGATDAGSEFADGSLKTGSLDNLRWEISGVNDKAGTFNIEIRRGDDSRRNPIILETFLGCSLDPKSDNYIAKVIGDQYAVQRTEGNQTFIEIKGENFNRSQYVYVSDVNLKTPDYLNNDGSVASDSSGASYSGSLPYAQSGSFHSGVGSNIHSSEANKHFDSIDNTNIQGLEATEYDTAINILKNKDEYRFNTITAPGIYNANYSSQVSSLIELCENRGDCFYIADLVKYGSSTRDTIAQAEALNSNFAGAYWPWVQVPSTELSKNVWVPASTVMQGVYAFNDNVAAPWFAPAGLNRGGLPVTRAEFKLTQGLRDDLYNAKVNPIATFPRNGVVAFGQKTLQTKASALDRINVRRLLISLKNFIGDTSRNLVFEQNTAVTRNRFLNAVNPFLESVQQRQGLFAFRVVMDESNNTADAIDRNQLVGQIFLQPTKTAEFIVLDYTVQPTGATFNE